MKPTVIIPNNNALLSVTQNPDYMGEQTQWSVDEQIENAIEWINTLAADDYNQTTGQMFSVEDQGFCCLGVADYCFGTRLSLDRGSFADNHEKAVGLRDYSGYPDPARGIKSLPSINDAGTPFPKIALQLVTYPHAYFIEPDADGVAEHFWRVK